MPSSENPAMETLEEWDGIGRSRPRYHFMRTKPEQTRASLVQHVSQSKHGYLYQRLLGYLSRWRSTISPGECTEVDVILESISLGRLKGKLREFKIVEDEDQLQWTRLIYRDNVVNAVTTNDELIQAAENRKSLKLTHYIVLHSTFGDFEDSLADCEQTTTPTRERSAFSWYSSIFLYTIRIDRQTATGEGRLQSDTRIAYIQTGKDKKGDIVFLGGKNFNPASITNN